jgi:hypothetical protein
LIPKVLFQLLKKLEEMFGLLKLKYTLGAEERVAV